MLMLSKLFRADTSFCGWLLCVVYIFVSGVCNAQEPLSLSILQAQVASMEKKSPIQANNVEDVGYIRARLQSMVNIDRYLRGRYSSVKSDEVMGYIAQKDQEHANEFKEILKAHFWISCKKFGEKACDNAWLLTQHSDNDLEFQHLALYRLEYCYKKGEASGKHYAFLYDRIALHYAEQGIRQRYGTQLNRIEGTTDQFKLAPFDGDLTELNNQRISVGFEVFTKEDLGIIRVGK